MTCVSSHRCLVSDVVRKKEFRLKGFISLEEINLSRQKQNYRFYLLDKSWYFPIRHVIYNFIQAKNKGLSKLLYRSEVMAGDHSYRWSQVTISDE